MLIEIGPVRLARYRAAFRRGRVIDKLDMEVHFPSLFLSSTTSRRQRHQTADRTTRRKGILEFKTDIFGSIW
jgi:hypothetical protein